MSTQSLKLRFASLASFAFGCLCAFTVGAEEFSWQFSGGTSERDGSVDASDTSLDATYYLDPIDDTNGPYALASFLNPATRVSAAASRADATSPITGNVDEPTALTLSGRYVWPGTLWYAGASYSKADVDNAPSPLERRSDPKGYNVVAGKYLGASTTLELAVGTSEQRSEIQLSCPRPAPLCIAVPITIETETESVSLDVFHVRQVRSLTYSLQGGISESNAELAVQVGGMPTVPNFGVDNTFRVYSVAGELFPTSRLGVRLGYSRPDGSEAPSSDGYQLATTWFFRPRVAVQFVFGRATVDDAEIEIGDADTAAVRFIGRL